MLFIFLMFFFFFKQKTAYEMRISDWSSDVCSSDLPDGCLDFARHERIERWGAPAQGQDGPHRCDQKTSRQVSLPPLSRGRQLRLRRVGPWRAAPEILGGEVPVQQFVDHRIHIIRSEERRVGQGWVCTDRFRWSPAH